MSQPMEEDASEYMRSMEDLNLVVGFAKLDGKQLTEVAQVRIFKMSISYF
jgi:hypothetical protein